MKTEREIKAILESTLTSKPENRLLEIKNDPRFVLPEPTRKFQLPKWSFAVAFAALLVAISFPMGLWSPSTPVEIDRVEDPIIEPTEPDVIPEESVVTPEEPVVQTKFLTSIVTLDINPSIRITLDQYGELMSINAVNLDGEIILANIVLDGLTLDEALNVILEEAYNQNYLADPSTDVVLIGVESPDNTVQTELSQQIEALVQSKATEKASNVTVVVETFNQLVTDETVRITKAKSLLIEQLLLTGTYTVDDISTLVTESIASLKERIETEYGLTINDVVAQTPDNEVLKNKLIEEILEESGTYTAESLGTYSIDQLKTVLKEVHGIDDDAVKEEENYTSVLAYTEEKRLKEEAEYQEDLLEIDLDEQEIRSELDALQQEYANASADDQEKLLEEIAKLQDELVELEVERLEAEIDYLEELQELEDEEQEAEESASQDAKDRKASRDSEDESDDESNDESNDESDDESNDESNDESDDEFDEESSDEFDDEDNSIDQSSNNDSVSDEHNDSNSDVSQSTTNQTEVRSETTGSSDEEYSDDEPDDSSRDEHDGSEYSSDEKHD